MKRTERRTFLTGLGTTGLILAAPAVIAQQRETLALASRGTVSACSNTGVMTSAIDGRLSILADFESAGTCQMTPDTVEGPYFICGGVESARDVSGGREGQAMALAVRVVDQTCTPIPGAFVDVWHCDARGFYSGHNVNPDDIQGARGTLSNTREPDLPERFLRGVLATDSDGIVEFDMIYPGYYDGRAIHTHYKVHIGNQAYLTAQALYPEDVNARVMTADSYADRSSVRVLNADDAPVILEPGLFKVVERNNRLLSVITLTVQT